MIYIIGDSHVSVFSGTDKGSDGLRHIQPEFGTCYTIKLGSLRPHNLFEQRIPYFLPIKIGSFTAYNSFNKIPIIEKVIEEYVISNDDYIFLCMGEIDIRNHIGPSAEKNNITINESIKICVDRYMDTIRYLKSKGHNICVYGPPASSIGWEDTFGYKDLKFRNIMTVEFNRYLRSICDEENIIFIDIASEMIMLNGETDPKYIMDDIHLSQEAMPLIKEKFKKIIKTQNEKNRIF